MNNQILFARLIYQYTIESFLMFVDEQDFKCYTPDKIHNVDDFNAYLYDLYLNGFSNIGYDKTIQVTKETGKKIYRKAKELYKIKPLNDVKSVIEIIISFFTDMEYICSGEIIQYEYNDYKYGELNENQFFYVMYSPVIYSSAKNLFNEIGIAPHFSSRTIQAALNEISVEADFDSSFNINLFEQDVVVEKWNIEVKNQGDINAKDM